MELNMTSRFCKVCPRKLSDTPDTPCPLALQSIAAIQSNSNTIGCPWYVADIEHNYCLWSYLKSRTDPCTDREISSLLLIPQKEIPAILEDAVNRLQNLDDGKAIELRDAILKRTSNSDAVEDMLIAKAIITDIPSESESKPKKDKKQLFGLYSVDTLKKKRDKK